jgi:hypothetical protein
MYLYLDKIVFYVERSGKQRDTKSIEIQLCYVFRKSQNNSFSAIVF